jgi:uncharacterized RDD family membrane protein YckC
MFCTHCGVALYEGAALCTGCGQPVAEAVPQAAPHRVAYASFWLRALALLIDSAVMAIPSMIVAVLAVAFMGFEIPPPDAPFGTLPPMRVFLPLEAMLAIVHWLYFALMESSAWQGTLGKRALGLGVSDLNGRRVSFGRASKRFFGKLISGMTFMMGYAMALFTEKRQALHDILSGCIVVKMP